MSTAYRLVLTPSSPEEAREMLAAGGMDAGQGRVGVPRNVPIARFSRWIPDAPAQEKPRQGLASYLEEVSSSIRRAAPPVQEVKATLGEYQPADSGVVYMWLHDGRSACRGLMRAGRAAEIARQGGEPPSRDDEVLVSVSPEYSPQWGFRLLVSDIRVLGRSQTGRERAEAELSRRGSLRLNAGLPFPPRLSRVAALAPDGAGLEDFNETVLPLEKAGLLQVDRRIATFEGPNASRSLCEAVDAIAAENRPRPIHDALFMLRGGGPPSSLAWLDDLELCERLARLPIPLVTGLGHERDSPLPEAVASRVLGTPSKAAHFLREACLALPLSALRSLSAIREAAARTLEESDARRAALIASIRRASPALRLASGWASVTDDEGRPVLLPRPGQSVWVTTAAGRFRLTATETPPP